MGVTIHFEGRLRSLEAYDDLISSAFAFARDHGWSVGEILPECRVLGHITDEREWDYSGETRGIEIFPHEGCEPFRLEVDSNRFVQEYTKTQLAPIEIHVALTALLKKLAPLFESLTVFDEGEYFESGSLEQLAEHRRFVENAIADLHAERPGCQSNVKLPSGRIVDFLS